MPVFLDVDPATLHLPQSRKEGADLVKLMKQFSRHGLSVVGMPPPWVHRDRNGRLKLIDSVTRATRVAKWIPGQTIRVEVTSEEFHDDFSSLPTVGDRLP